MKILMVSSEVAPYAKVGGLADVVSSLSKDLAHKGHDVRILCPLYAFITTDTNWRAYKDLLFLEIGGQQEFCRVWEVKDLDSPASLFFLENEKFFGGDEIYHISGLDKEKIAQRFAFLSRAAIEFCRYSEWIPDIIHCHDWVTSLVPVILKFDEKDPSLAQIPTVLNIHNIHHQGIFNRQLLDFTGLPHTLFNPKALEFHGSLNVLKGGIIYATKLITVSESYAKEIVDTELGCNLNDVLKERQKDLSGIINGIDPTVWNPAIDQLIPKNYSIQNMNGKKECKRFLQRNFNLSEDPNLPIFGVVARLYWQKGLDLLLGIIPQLMQNAKLQIVLLGTGEEIWETQFKQFALEYKGSIGVNIGQNERLPHLIEAGSDFFLMPSRFEPCGLNQMYSMSYGSVPIVHATGGLLDTVEPYIDEKTVGTGFVFEDATTESFYNSILKACDIFYHNNNIYQLMQNNGMKKDFSWKKSVAKYEEVYISALKMMN